MHELALAQNIIDTVRIYCANDLSLVKEIHLTLGKFCGVNVEALRFGLDLLGQGLFSKGLQTRIDEPPLVLECESCHEKTTAADFIFLCPKCQGTAVSIISGRELQIQSIVVEEKG